MKGRLLMATLAFVLLATCGSRAQEEVDYKAEFAENWEKAEKILLGRQPEMQKLAAQFEVPFPEVIAVAFPEVVRYSALRDKIELTLLKSLYVYKGEDYADFSVGIFQMKPSFAEKVRSEALASGDKTLAGLFVCGFDPSQTTEFRKSILADMEDPVRQFGYLLAFYKLCEKKFGQKSWETPAGKVRFYAAAYNCGFTRPEVYISEMAGEKFFSLNLLHIGPFYPYSEIAAYYFNNSKF